MWFALTAAMALALSPADVRNPRPTAWVSDMAGVIDDDAEARINQRLTTLNLETGVEIAVVTVPSVTDGTTKQFATGLFNHWGVGSRERDDGLLVLLAVEQRRLEMETGYGLEEALPDGWLGVMQSQRMVPLFKHGDFSGGIEAGLEATDARIRGAPAPAGLGGGLDVQPVRPLPPLPPVWVVGGAVLLFGLMAVVVVLVWRRRRTCPTCRILMVPLGEAWEDAYLDEGQEEEERIGSVRWDVYQCTSCDHTRSFGHRALFSGYSRCPQCTYRTRSSSSKTVSLPTTRSSGSTTVTERCTHCSYYNSYKVVLARLSESTSSSSGRGGGSSLGSSRGGGRSRGGSFGGGSSRGGGAGSSW